MEQNPSAYIQNQLRQAQQIELQLEQTASQRYQLDLRIKELDKTLRELEGVKEDSPVFKAVGMIVYRVEDRKKLKDELEEQKELSEIRIKTLDKQQKVLEDKYKEIEQVIRQSYDDMKKGKGGQN
ncbi:MAG: prefoldin subunit beta [Candidatus Thermoplasmatota archaeon]|nr:prefoldin subunit beta [Candidatus Thermoplasmatota archaeon]